MESSHTCALNPVPASMMSAHSSCAHDTEEMNKPSSFPLSTCCSILEFATL